MFLNFKSSTLLLIIVSICYAELILPKREKKDVDDREIKQAANFALEQLKMTSETGIYETITITEIITAFIQEGPRYRDIILTVRLDSPYIKNPETKTYYEIIVFKGKYDFAGWSIDEFPVMKEEAVEEFYIEKVRKETKKRENYIRELIDSTEEIPDIDKYWVEFPPVSEEQYRKLKQEEDHELETIRNDMENYEL